VAAEGCGALKIEKDIAVNDQYLDLLKSVLCASLYDESAWRRVEGPMKKDMIASSIREKLVSAEKHFLLRWLRGLNLLLVRTNRFDAELRDRGLDWPLFGFTMTGRRRLDALHFCVEDVLDNRIPGDFAETGVWRGGSVILMRALLRAHNVTDRVVWCADSFEGMPVPNETDKQISASANFSDRAYLNVSLEDVKKNFERFGLLDEQVRFLKGWFSETLPIAPIKELALLRLDGDLYESTRDALIHLYDKVSPGGSVIIDDYNSWEGCRLAVDEFRKNRGISQPMTAIDPQSILWKVRDGSSNP
jgi:O-methyltransferase